MHTSTKLACSLLALAALYMSGCAAAMKGTDQAVLVTTPGVTDATCTLTSPEIGTRTVRTPGSVSLEKSQHDITVSCTKEGYEDATGVISSEWDATTLGNIILGGAVGLVADAASGAAYEYASSITVQMASLDEGEPGMVQPGTDPSIDAPATSLEQPGPPPRCKDVGGYEAYMQKTGNVCML